MANVKIRLTYKDFNKEDTTGSIAAYGIAEINPYDPSSDLCNELAYSYAVVIAKDRAGHENIDVLTFNHEEDKGDE